MNINRKKKKQQKHRSVKLNSFQSKGMKKKDQDHGLESYQLSLKGP